MKEENCIRYGTQKIGNNYIQMVGMPTNYCGDYGK
jgi:hypothetical protein